MTCEQTAAPPHLAAKAASDELALAEQKERHVPASPCRLREQKQLHRPGRAGALDAECAEARPSDAGNQKPLAK